MIAEPNAEPLELPALMSVERVAAFCDVSESHVWRQSDAGRMPKPIKVGRLKKWIRSELESWLDNRCKPLRASGAN
jgi:predicted DNA-binding transcriptional regulator AlpA